MAQMDIVNGCPPPALTQINPANTREGIEVQAPEGDPQPICGKPIFAAEEAPPAIFATRLGIRRNTR